MGRGVASAGGNSPWVRVALLLCALALFAAVTTPAGAPVHPASAQEPPYTVDVKPTAALSDGTKVTITLHTTTDYPIYAAEARVCRSGVTYQSSAGERPNDDVFPNGPNCPLAGVSSSADPVSVAGNPYKFASTPQGEAFTLKVGVGVVQWDFNGTPQSLTCDQAHSCTLVVELYTGPSDQAPVWVPVPFDLAFIDADPVAGCGGPSVGALSGAASDSMSDAWVRWTLATCNQEGTSGAWTGMSFAGEGDAVSRFAQGQLDLAYTATGYDPDVGLVDTASVPNGPRPAVAVPIGLNAVVLGLGNGYVGGDGRKLPYDDVHMTLDELAALVTGGQWQIDQTALASENPQLAAGGVFQQGNVSFRVGAPSDSGSSAWLLTRYLHTLRQELWKVPDLPLFGEVTGKPRGTSNSFALADPTFANALDLYTGRPALVKQVDNLAPDPGGVWAITDLTAAEALDVYPVTIDNAQGVPTRPDAQSMADAVNAMSPDSNGMLIPDPNSSAGYPLTYVVYALVPAEPLADGVGVCRSQSQELLAKWLDYAVGDGQSNLPDGLEPLTPALKEQAQDRIADVGATPAATPCRAPDGGGGPGGGSPDGSGANGSGASSSGVVPVSTSGSAASSGSSSDGSESAAAANAELSASDSSLPDFLGANLPSVLLAVGALLGMVWLVVAATRASSGPATPAVIETEPVHVEPAGTARSTR